MAQEKRTPSVFFSLLPLGMANVFCLGIATSSLVLQTIELASKSPEHVYLLPHLLQYGEPAAIAGLLLGAYNLGVGILGPVSGKVTDQLGAIKTCYVSEAIQVLGAALMASTSTYLIGVVFLTIGSGCSQASFQSLFGSQFDDEHMTQKHVSYLYAAQNAAFFVATVLAGIQPFSYGYMQSAVLTFVSMLFLPSAPVRSKNISSEQIKVSQYPLSPQQSARVNCYMFLCICTFLFFVVFLQFLGGPFVLLAKDRVGALGTVMVPPSFFLGLNGFTDLLLAAVLIKIYKACRPIKFHVKLCFSFFWLMMGSGSIAYASAGSPNTKVNPIFAALAIVFVSIGELHYNPVMLAAIPTEMPLSMVGLFTGVHFMICGVAGSIAGLGVPVYERIGPSAYFGFVTLVAASGLLVLGLAAPYLARTFEARDDLSETRTLQN